MKTLRECIKEAENKKVAIGHFNISNLEALHGICNAVKKLDVPAIIGLSEGEENFFGKNEAVALIKEIREKNNFPIFLNADHHYSFKAVKTAIDAGFDAVVIDAVKLSLEKNIALTKKCVDYAKEISKKENRDILVEGELGFIGISSKLLDKIPEGVRGATMTKPEDTKYFVKKTGIDLLAPSIGNIHGMVKGGNPKLNIERIKEIRKTCGIPLVLHGGSGISDEDFINAIKAGISIIHINTEIRIAYKEALEKYLKENSNEITPYKRLKLFNRIK